MEAKYQYEQMRFVLQSAGWKMIEKMIGKWVDDLSEKILGMLDEEDVKVKYTAFQLEMARRQWMAAVIEMIYTEYSNVGVDAESDADAEYGL